MSDMNAPAPRLNIPTRDMVFAYLLAMLVAIVVGALVESRYHDLHRIVLPVAHMISATLFVLLTMLGGKQSLPAIVAATSLRQPPRPGRVLSWILVAILAGLIFRFGLGGLGYTVEVVLHLLQPSSPAPSLIEYPDGPLPNIDALLILSVLLGAAVEEFSYRRILQSFFCRKYGLWTGILGVSVAFGAIHASIGIMLAGFCFALLYLYSGRLWVAIIAHAMTNLAVYSMNKLQPSKEALLAWCSLTAVLLIVVLAVAIRAIRQAPRIYD